MPMNYAMILQKATQKTNQTSQQDRDEGAKTTPSISSAKTQDPPRQDPGDRTVKPIGHVAPSHAGPRSLSTPQYGSTQDFAQFVQWHKHCVTIWREPRRRRTEKNGTSLRNPLLGHCWRDAFFCVCVGRDCFITIERRTAQFFPHCKWVSAGVPTPPDSGKTSQPRTSKLAQNCCKTDVTTWREPRRRRTEKTKLL